MCRWESILSLCVCWITCTSVVFALRDFRDDTPFVSEDYRTMLDQRDGCSRVCIKDGDEEKCVKEDIFKPKWPYMSKEEFDGDTERETMMKWGARTIYNCNIMLHDKWEEVLPAVNDTAVKLDDTKMKHLYFTKFLAENCPENQDSLYWSLFTSRDLRKYFVAMNRLKHAVRHVPNNGANASLPDLPICNIYKHCCQTRFDDHRPLNIMRCRRQDLEKDYSLGQELLRSCRLWRAPKPGQKFSSRRLRAALMHVHNLKPWPIS